MINQGRRRFLTLAARTTASAAGFRSFRHAFVALAIPAFNASGTIADVQHIVILMQENRSFDHYFGTLRGVRGFGDRFPFPLASGKPIWFQSDGTREIPPFRLDTRTTSAFRCPTPRMALVDARPHGIRVSLASGQSSRPLYSMGHYQRADIPFQFALAEAFTICDAYHCSDHHRYRPEPHRLLVRFKFRSRASRAGRTIAPTPTRSPTIFAAGSRRKLPIPGLHLSRQHAFNWPTIPDVLGTGRHQLAHLSGPE